MPRVCIAIGSNLGDRRAHVHWAVEQLSRQLQHVRVSTVIETEPQEVADTQPAYLNAVVVGDTELSAGALFEALTALERSRGRERRAWHAPRTLDLDLVLYGDEVVDRPGLVVPHPRFRDRRFVLEPLVELEPRWRDPISGQTAQELLDALEGKKKGG